VNIEGKVVLITGASSGIGLATAREFAKAKSKVVLVARREAILKDIENEIKSNNGYALAVCADISDKYSVQSIIRNIRNKFGRIDILINNAGIGINSAVSEIKIEDLRKVFEVNLFGPLYLIQEVLPLMIEQKKALIVNILSLIARRTLPKAGGISASKAALMMLTDSLRMEIAIQNIKVINVYPGFTLTSFSQNILGEKSKGRGKKFAISPDRVGKAIIKAVKNEKRDVYVTLSDRILVGLAQTFPNFADKVMRRLWL